MDNKILKDVLLKLIQATTADEVSKLVSTHPFFKECDWRHYGDQANNAGTIKAQSPDPIGALVEKITNGIDALLSRKCWEAGIDPTSTKAPQSQRDAVKDFFGKNAAEGNLSDKEIRELAAQTVRIIAEGGSDSPTITVVDSGEGQSPKNFPDTFLSLGGSNKIKIKFAHGVYNQGGSAALQFCSGGYQLILSRRAPEVDKAGSGQWGFTLVRERYEPGYKAEWFEYCVIKNGDRGEVPSIPYEPLPVLPNKENLESGSFVRLYGYTLKNPNFFITGQRERELAREINKRYFMMPLPILLQERRTHLKGWDKKNEFTRISGLWKLLGKQFKKKEIVRTVLPLKAELDVFGLRTLQIVVLNDESDEGQSYKSQTEKIFLTINGQAQHTETINFLKTECLLPDLAPFLLIHIDLSNAGYEANKIFHTSRKGLIERPEYEHFHDRLVNSIKGDETLKELNKEYKERKLLKAQPEDKDLSKYIGKLVQDNPYLAALLKGGKEVPAEKPDGKEGKYIGVYVPTMFDLVGEVDIKIPHNRYARVRFKTDAVNDYLTRAKDNGEIKWTASKLVQINHYSLKDGYLPARLDPVAGVKVGDTDEITFEMTRPGQESLKAVLKITIGDHEEPVVHPPGPPPQPKKSALKLPKQVLVPKSDWATYGWGDRDIGKVEEDQEGITVYINRDPLVLTSFPQRNPKYSSGDAVAAIQKRYFASVYLYALSMFFEMKDKSEERDWALPISLKAISKFILDLAFTSRGQLSVDED